MNDTMPMKPQFDRTAEDLGNIVELGHVNVTVPDQSKAIAFYLMGLGLTRDPYLMAGLENMWVNVGRGQFHLPTRSPAQVVRGTTGLIVPDLEALLKRLDYVTKFLDGTQFSFKPVRQRGGDHLPLGQPDPHARAGAGEFRSAASRHAVCRVRRAGRHQARQDRAVLCRDPGWHRRRRTDERGAYAWASTSADSRVIYRESPTKHPEYDGHHIQITLADFSGPHKKLLERGPDHRGERPAPVPASSTSSMWTATSRCSRSSTRRGACAIRCSTAPSSTAMRT
ncbi:MAG: hypothetical protein WDN25_14220 [Acetobacteraceae bacterium]